MICPVHGACDGETATRGGLIVEVCDECHRFEKKGHVAQAA